MDIQQIIWTLIISYYIIGAVYIIKMVRMLRQAKRDELFKQCSGKHKTEEELFTCQSCELLFKGGKR